ncbi:MAG: transporter [Chitinophagaceae bacterium]|nr:MAG: transporter [Chitinophagaceae bacterium]
MKPLSVLFLLLALSAAPARACDICGCGVSYYNPNLFPHLSKNFVGLSYLHRLYHTAGHEGSVGTERYNSLLLTVQYAAGKRLKLVALLPWQFNTLRNEGGRRTLSGAGDATLLAQYRVWERSSDKGVRQVFVAGAGVKLPSGRYTAAAASKTEEQNFQLGTGSTDVLLNGVYRLNVRRWSLSATGSYKYNTVNRDGFRYGDVLNTGVQAAFRRERRNWSLTPYLQASGEWQLTDASNHVLQPASGGEVVYAGGGVDFNTRKVSLGVNYQAPIAQHLAGGLVQAKPGFSVRTTFLF